MDDADAEQPGLFPEELVLTEPREPKVDPPTDGQRLRDRQAARIAAGWHPLSYGGRRIVLHLKAERPLENDGKGGDPFRCGSCVFRQLMGGHAKSYAKCTQGRTEKPVPVRLQTPGGPRLIIRTPRATGGEASDVRAWWPGCADWKARDSDS